MACGTAELKGEDDETSIAGAGALFASTAAFAGPEKIKFPTDYLKGELYQTLDRPDNKQYRELYAPAEAIEAVRKGQPIPHGTVLTLVQWSVEQDANGNPIKDANGRFIKKDILAHTVMEKQQRLGRRLSGRLAAQRRLGIRGVHPRRPAQRQGERQQQGLLHLPPAARQAGLRHLARQAEQHLPEQAQTLAKGEGRARAT